MSGESLAQLFAHRLLVPSLWFAHDAPASGFEVLELKRRYHTTSHEVIAWRLLDLTEPSIITVIDNDRVARRRSNAWTVKRTELSAPEKKCQGLVNRTGSPQSVREAGWTVQGWPVHRPDWRREILRSVVEWEGSV
jgi:hypothetical protein